MSGSKSKAQTYAPQQAAAPIPTEAQPVEVPSTLPNYLYSGGAFSHPGSSPGQNTALAEQMAAGGYGTAAEWAPRLAALSTAQSIDAAPKVDPRVIAGSQFAINKKAKEEAEKAAAAEQAAMANQRGFSGSSRPWAGGMINSWGQLASILRPQERSR